MRGREFLRVAEFLKELETEGSLRTQVSRFYYAAYLESCAYCERIMGYNRTRSSAEHAEFPRLFQSVDPEVTASLAFLRELRNTADCGTLPRAARLNHLKSPYPRRIMNDPEEHVDRIEHLRHAAPAG